MFSDLKELKMFKALKDYKKWSVTYQLLGLLIILVSIPVTVLLLRSFALYLSRAAQYDLYFDPDPVNLTSTPQQVALLFDSGSDPVGFVQLEMTFDPTLINLAAPIDTTNDINPYFKYKIEVTDQATANSTGVIRLVLGGDEAQTPVSGIFGKANLQFEAVTGSSTTTQIAFNTGFTNIVNASDDTSLPVTHVPVTVNVNSTSTATPTPTSTISTPTPTPTPSSGGNTFTIDATEDTYVDSSQPDTAFGSSTVLQVDGSPERISYFRFTLPQVDPTLITDARFVLGVSSSEGLSLQSVHVPQTYNWSGNMTYNTRVDLFNPFTSFTASGTTSQEIDITNWVINRITTFGSGEIVLAITSTDSNGYVYTSTESGNPPQIVITASDTPVITPTPTSFPTATPTPTPQSVAPDTDISLITADPIIEQGTEFAVDAEINTGINEVIGVELSVNFDPTRLTAIDIVPGTFFSQVDTTNKVIDNTNGIIELTMVTPPTSTAVRGIGQLAVMTFRADTLGQTTLSVNQSTLVAAVNVYQNALQNTFPLTIEVVQQVCGNTRLPGDIDNDCDVDIIDYGILFEDFGKSSTDPTLVDPDSDINSDGQVNILDYVLLFENFGRTV